MRRLSFLQLIGFLSSSKLFEINTAYLIIGRSIFDSALTLALDRFVITVSYWFEGTHTQLLFGFATFLTEIIKISSALTLSWFDFIAVSRMSWVEHIHTNLLFLLRRFHFSQLIRFVSSSKLLETDTAYLIIWDNIGFILIILTLTLILTLHWLVVTASCWLKHAFADLLVDFTTFLSEMINIVFAFVLCWLLSSKLFEIDTAYLIIGRNIFDSTLALTLYWFTIAVSYWLEATQTQLLFGFNAFLTEIIKTNTTLILHRLPWFYWFKHI